MGISDAQVVYLDRTVYVGGGVTSGTWRDHAGLYFLMPGVDSSWTTVYTPTYCYALTEHDSELLLVGGFEYPSEEVTNRIFTLVDGEFVEALPPMGEKRSSPSAFSSGSALVVAGGSGTSGVLSSVEVFKDGQWMAASSLPAAGEDMKAALSGDQCYLLQLSGRVFCVSLLALVSEKGLSAWVPLPTTPNRDSAAAFFGGHLLSIGGGECPIISSAIFAFIPDSQLWAYVDELPVPLMNSSAAVLPTGELIVIGGDDRDWNRSSKVFHASVKGFFNYKHLVKNLYSFLQGLER